MRVWDSELLTRKSGGLSPVTDGLVLWIDSQDGLFNSDGSSIPDGTTKAVYLDDVCFLNRANGTLIRINDIGVSQHGYRTCDISCSKNHYFSFLVSSVPSGSSGFVIGFEANDITDTVLTSEVLISASTRIAYSQVSVGNLAVDLSNTNIALPSNQNAGIYKLQVSNSSLYDAFPIQITANAYGDGIKKALYRNGTLVKSNDLDLPTGSYFVPKFQISGSLTYCRESDIASMRMYNRALTANEVAQNYQYELSTGRLPI